MKVHRILRICSLIVLFLFFFAREAKGDSQTETNRFLKVDLLLEGKRNQTNHVKEIPNGKIWRKEGTVKKGLKRELKFVSGREMMRRERKNRIRKILFPIFFSIFFMWIGGKIWTGIRIHKAERERRFFERT